MLPFQSCKIDGIFFRDGQSYNDFIFVSLFGFTRNGFLFKDLEFLYGRSHLFELLSKLALSTKNAIKGN